MRNSTFKIIGLLVIMLLAFGAVSAQEEDTLNILYWQAVSTMNPYLSGGTKDIEASSMVLDPLAHFEPDGTLVPILVEEIPTVENGGVSADLTTITWKLKEGILWSDGTPLTAEDAVFSWEYCVHPDAGCNALSNFADVASVEAVDDLTILITFSIPKPFPYNPLVGSTGPVIQKAQFQDCTGAATQSCTEENFGPIGTGPFVVEEFRANDVVTFVANPNYREEGKPGFARAIFKGGGDAESAARAVLETGEMDYAWNLQVAPEILNRMAEAGEGVVVVSFGPGVERLVVNQTNPDPDLGDMRSVWSADDPNPHPFLTDPAVWKALSMAIDRNIIATQLYGAGGQAGCNILPAPPMMASPNNDDCLVQDIEGANALLDEAGIVDTDGDGIREKDGVPLKILYQTSTNAVRQSTQALVKQWWSEIGVETELRNISADVFFGGDVASPDTYGKFYADINMYTNTFDGTDPEKYLASWLCEAEIPGPQNDWLGNNIPRWCNREYEALVEELSKTAALEERAALAIQMNDMLIQTGAFIPLVWRGDVSAVGSDIQGVRMNSWDSELWNVADWVRVQ